MSSHKGVIPPLGFECAGETSEEHCISEDRLLIHLYVLGALFRVILFCLGFVSRVENTVY